MTPRITHIKATSMPHHLCPFLTLNDAKVKVTVEIPDVKTILLTAVAALIMSYLKSSANTRLQSPQVVSTTAQPMVLRLADPPHT